MAKKSPLAAGFSKYDLFFGHPMRMNFGGRDRYGTTCGALMTIII